MTKDDLPPLPEPEMIYDKEADVLVSFKESGAIDLDDGRVCPTCVRLYSPEQVREAQLAAIAAHDAKREKVLAGWKYENLHTGRITLLQERSSVFTLSELTYKETPLYAYIEPEGA